MSTFDYSAAISSAATANHARAEEMMALRRDLHRHPERRLRLPRTRQAILDGLAGLPYELHFGESLDSIMAVLPGDLEGPMVLLRGDMDALPIQEHSGEEFSSTNDLMHACGHDLHVAGLVGAGRTLAELGPLPGTVVLMFQPGEEDPGGAKIMVAEGSLEAAGRLPDAAFAVHVNTDKRGVITTREGAMMASVTDLRIRINGQGGHGSRPHMATDPISVGAEITLALQNYITRRINIFDPVVMNVGQFQTEGPLNAIPSSAHLGISVRTFSDASLAQLHEEVPRLVHGIAGAYGCTTELDWHLSCPVTMNDDVAASTAIADLRELFGEERVERAANPWSGSEDFSYVLQRIPGALLMLGACPPELDPATAPNNHSDRVRFDDSVLPDQATILTTLTLGAMRRLSANASA
ncbi:M20 metallopeptidase family protein [Ornithinimicrobium pratense]|nr:M20 family metallopeptidase [Ornithinimicrobium pratense]